MRKRTCVGALAVLLMLAGCGDDDDTSVGADTGVQEDSDADPSADDADGTGDSDDGVAGTADGLGTITINGDVYPVTTLNRCEPASGGETDLDLQALGDGVKINLYSAGGVIEDVSVDGSGVEDAYGSAAFGQDPVIDRYTVESDRTTGAVTIADSRGSGATVDVEWDVQVPAEIRDCGV